MKAAVLRELKKPMTIEDFQTPPIGADEVLLKVKARGVCHTEVWSFDRSDRILADYRLTIAGKAIDR